MTIRDMLDAGITIQGAYEIRTFNGDCAITLVQGSLFDEEKCDIEDEYLDMEVKYIYTILLRGFAPTADGSCLVIEVENND